MVNQRIDLQSLCEEVLGRLPEECGVWREIIKDEIMHVLHSSTHAMGLVHQDELARLRQQLDVIKGRMDKLELLINQLDQSSE